MKGKGINEEEEIRTKLDKCQQKDLTEQIYGKHSTWGNRNARQNRLLKSWMEMGYPLGGGESATF